MGNSIKIVSCTADSVGSLHRVIAEYFTQHGISATLIDELPCSERERLFDSGVADVAFLSGPSYAKRFDRSPGMFEILGAPVMKGSRYKNRPIYFSDVVVRRESAAQSFADLRNGTWARLETELSLGWDLFRFHLDRLGKDARLGGRVIESKSAESSLQMVVDGLADATAMDSTLLELEYKLHPELAPQLRTIQTFGPSPAPPVVVRKHVDERVRAELRRLLLTLHESEEGRTILASGMRSQYVEVLDVAYDAFRRLPRRPSSDSHLAPAT